MANIITISREFGSGGRELGKRLADVLGYDYYDREIISEISKKYQLNEDFVEQTLNKQVWKTVPLNYGRTISYFNTMHTSHMNLLIEEKEILEKIASSNRNCIIVGRNSDILLEKYNPFSIFVCADMESKIQRCINRMSQEEKKTIKAIENEIKAIDKTRSKTRELICENKWGDRSDYNLIINTTGWNLKDLSQTIAPVISKWFEVKNEN